MPRQPRSTGSFTASLLSSKPRRSTVAPSRLSNSSPNTPAAVAIRNISHPPAKANGSRRGHRCSGQSSGKCAEEAEIAPSVSRLNRAERGDHARYSTQHLANFGRDGVCSRLRQCGQPNGEWKRRSPESAGDPMHVKEAFLPSENAKALCQRSTTNIEARVAMPRFAATCAGARPWRFSAVPNCSFLARPRRVASDVSAISTTSGTIAVRHGR